MVIMERVKNTPKISKDNDKFEFTGEQTTVKDETGKEYIVYRIKANKDIIVNGKIVAHKGDLGGFIEKEENLDYKSSAWVSGNAKIYGGTSVLGDTYICGDVRIYGETLIRNAFIFGYDGAPIHDVVISGDTPITIGFIGNSEVREAPLRDRSN